MEVLNWIREYVAGFRMPDLTKLWYGNTKGDEIDSGKNEPILIQVGYPRVYLHFSTRII